MDKWDWTEETYRLDEVVHRFNVPCVVQVTEGFLCDNELESMSAGDIIKIDEQRSLQKVAANFLSEFHRKCNPQHKEGDYVHLSPTKEVLLPLNYKGKLKVLLETKTYKTVSELSTDGPRFAKMMATLKYRTQQGGRAEISAGTVIEIDRLILGSARANREDILIVSFTGKNGEVSAALPVSTPGMFMSEDDPNVYTLQEMIDRYKLPQVIRFEPDGLKDIKRAYSEDLLDSLANSRTFTETVRLNRLVTQNVLVGHYKALEECEEADAAGTRKRTLVVLPLDSDMMREIEVNVAQGVDESVYEDVLKIFRNASEDFDDGAIYVDFAMDAGIRRIQSTFSEPEPDYQNNDTASSQNYIAMSPQKCSKKPRVPTPPLECKTAPPRPPARRIVSPPFVQQGNKGLAELDDGYMRPEINPHLANAAQDDTHPYLELGPSLDFSLSDVFGKCSTDGPVYGNQKKSDVHESKDKKTDKKDKKKEKKDKKHEKTGKNKGLKKTESILQRPRMPIPDVPNSPTQLEDLHVYDDVSDLNQSRIALCAPTTRAHSRLPPPNRTGNTGVVAPTPRNLSAPSTVTDVPKRFSDLSCSELYDRLMLCEMKDMASACKRENLDGAFFHDVTDDMLTDDPFELNKFHLMKFHKLKNNWVPKKT